MHTKIRFVLNVFIIAFILIATLPFISLAQGKNSSTVKPSVVVERVESTGATRITSETIYKDSIVEGQWFGITAYFVSSTPDKIRIIIISSSNKKHYDKDNTVSVISIIDGISEIRKPISYDLVVREKGKISESLVLEFDHSDFAKLIEKAQPVFMFADKTGIALDSKTIDIWSQFYSAVGKFTGQRQSKPMESKVTLDDSLRAAIAKEDASAVQNLLSKGANPNLKTNGFPILVFVAGNGNQSIFQALIDKGGDVDVTTVDGFTSLMMAAFFGHSSIVQILLAKNAIRMQKQIKELLPLCRLRRKAILILHRLCSPMAQTYALQIIKACLL